MPEEKFVVGCAAIGLYSGAVFLDLNGLSMTERDDKGQPVRELCQRIIMTPDALLETFNAIQGLLARLEQAGVIKRTQPGAQAAGGADQPPAEEKTDKKAKSGDGGKQPKSPNF